MRASAPRAHRPARRCAEPLEPALRLPLPHPLPQDAGPLQDREAAASRCRRRQDRGLPLSERLACHTNGGKSGPISTSGLMLSGAGLRLQRAVRVGEAGGERSRDASVSKHAPAPTVPANMRSPQLASAPCVLRLGPAGRSTPAFPNTLCASRPKAGSAQHEEECWEAAVGIRPSLKLERCRPVHRS